MHTQGYIENNIIDHQLVYIFHNLVNHGRCLLSLIFIADYNITYIVQINNMKMITTDPNKLYILLVVV